jgi:hypothetical protein
MARFLSLQPGRLAAGSAGYLRADPFYDLVRFVLGDLDKLVLHVTTIGGD